MAATRDSTTFRRLVGQIKALLNKELVAQPLRPARKMFKTPAARGPGLLASPGRWFCPWLNDVDVQVPARMLRRT